MAVTAGHSLVPPPEPSSFMEASKISEAVVVAYYSAYAGYCNATAVQVSECPFSDKSVSSPVPVSEPGSEPSVGSSASSGRAKARARWRANVKRRTSQGSFVSQQSNVKSFSDGASLASVNGDGHCYLQMFKEEFRCGARRALAANPTFNQLVTVPGQWFVSEDEMLSLRLVRVRPGVYHLGRCGGPHLLEALRAYHEDYGDAGANLPAYVTSAEVASDLLGKLKPSDVLGADGVSFSQWLHNLCGASDKGIPDSVVELLSKSAAMRSPADRTKGKMLEALGDSVLSTSVALRCVVEGRSADEYQNARSKVTSNPSLSGLFAKKVPKGYVVFPHGVDPGTGKAGAYQIEAMLGAIYQAYGQSGVTCACENLGIFDLHDW